MKHWLRFLIIVVMQFVFVFCIVLYANEITFDSIRIDKYDLPLVIQNLNGEESLKGLRLPYCPADSVFIAQGYELNEIYQQPYLLLFNQKLMQTLIVFSKEKKEYWNDANIDLQINNKGKLKKNEILSFFSTLDENSNYEYYTSDSKWLQMKIINQGNIMQITMPKERQYLSGMDKKELGDYWLERLDRIIPNKLQNFNIEQWHTYAIQDPAMTIYEEKSNTDGFSRKVYYFIEGDSTKLVWDSKYPAESLYNLFFSYKNEDQINLNIKFLLYGDNSRTREMTLHEFLAKMSNDCQLSLLVEEVKDDRISFSLLFEEAIYDQVHLLYTTISVNELISQSGIWDAKMILSIPRDESIKIKKFDGDYRGRFLLR
ncbi:MAG TPA: hypothetical protein PKZ69_03945 [Candidatus Cloacimonadota bacterium]|nr:hypothetical protein [Candidatus Cloacimonadota bacterium]